MKKLIAMIATVAVVLSMGVTAMAAVPAVDKRDSAGEEQEKITAAVQGEDDVVVRITELQDTAFDYTDVAKNVKEGGYARAFQATVVAKVGVDEGALSGSEMNDEQLALDRKSQPFTLLFRFDDADKVSLVYVFTNGKWQPTSAWDHTDDGRIKITTVDDGVYAFVVNPDENQVIQSQKDNNYQGEVTNAGAGSSSVVNSPATGYNSMAYIVCAIALAAGAAFFFGTSKKSAKEMM